MNENLKKLALAAVVATALAACGRGENNAAAPASSGNTSATAPSSSTATSTASGATNTTSGVASITDFDRNFMMQAAQGGLLEVEASKLAQDRAESQPVKQFAEMMVNDHSGANAKLKDLAQAKNVSLPTELNADGKQKLEKLSALKGGEFDRTYAELLGTEEHRQDVALFEKAASDAGDPDVKAFASTTLPTLREHLAQAERIAKDSVAAAK